MRSALLLALVLVTSACGKKDAGSASGSGSAGGSAATSDPGATSADAAQVACNEDEIRKHVDDNLAGTVAYLEALEKKTAKWGKDCEQAKQDLLALEPEATKFIAGLEQFTSWGRTLSPVCAKRVQEIGEPMYTASAIEKYPPLIEPKIKRILEACKDHPGMMEAAAKGLRLPRKKAGP